MPPTRAQFAGLLTSNTSGLLVVAAFCCVIYGLIVGSFSGGQQIWAAPLKIATGMLVSGLICLPSLYIFSCLSGSPVRLVQAFGVLAGLPALSAILLIGFAPVAWVFPPARNPWRGWARST
jgi:hypothetical protein